MKDLIKIIVSIKICTNNLTEIHVFLTKNIKFPYKTFDYVKNTLHLYTSSTK